MRKMESFYGRITASHTASCRSNRDSREENYNGYQKFPYRIVFDVKFNLRHEARQGAGWN
jgi:hypothetical protein